MSADGTHSKHIKLVNLQRTCNPLRVMLLHVVSRKNRICGGWGLGMCVSMVDTEGSVAIASRRQDGQRGEERKVDLVVRELKRYNVKVAGLQETKWFDCEVY